MKVTDQNKNKSSLLIGRVDSEYACLVPGSGAKKVIVRSENAVVP